MRSCAGQSRDQEPCVKYLQGQATRVSTFWKLHCGEKGYTLWGTRYLQHRICFIPSQVMLNVDSCLGLHRETYQTQDQKGTSVGIALAGGRLGLEVRVSLVESTATTAHLRTKRRRIVTPTVAVALIAEQWGVGTALGGPVEGGPQVGRHVVVGNGVSAAAQGAGFVAVLIALIPILEFEVAVRLCRSGSVRPFFLLFVLSGAVMGVRRMALDCPRGNRHERRRGS